MKLHIETLEGSKDGLRFGLLVCTPRHKSGRFRWSYDMIGDRLRLWKVNTGDKAPAEIADPEAEAAARLIVRDWLGMGI